MGEASGCVAGLDARLVHVYEMSSGPYRHRSRRLRRLLMSSRRWFLLLVLSAFIAINSLLYRGINRIDGRSMDPRSLPVQEKVISIDSWQTDEDIGGARWDLYIDSPRQFQGLSVSQREKGDSEAGVNRVAAPVVRYIRRGGDNNTNVDKKPVSGLESDTEGDAAKRVNARLNYKHMVDKNQRGRTSRNTPTNQNSNVPNEMAIGRRQINTRNLVHVKSSFSQSKLYRAPVKLKNHVSNIEDRRFQPSNGNIGRRIIKPSPAQTNDDIGGVRFYNRPPWLSENDAEMLRLLADDHISSFQTFPSKHAGKLGLGFLIYESEFRTGVHDNHRTNSSVAAHHWCNVKGVTCAVLFPPAEIHRVLAFHLDRVLGFNRTLPTVSRKLTDDLRRQAGLPVDVSFPVMLYDPSLYKDAELAKITRAQLSHCVGGDDGTEGLQWCDNILTEDWGAVALFDFLLQIYHRLDLGCCGLEVSERHRRCGMTGSRGVRCMGENAAASQQEIGCNYRQSSDGDKLILVENLVDLHAPADKLDFWLIQGPNSFPARAVTVLREGRLHQMLLQSLFADKGYWEGQGGRPTIEEVLDIIDRRAKIFLKHISSVGD